jgi:hypothetical protein
VFDIHACMFEGGVMHVLASGFCLFGAKAQL